MEVKASDAGGKAEHRNPNYIILAPLNEVVSFSEIDELQAIVKPAHLEHKACFEGHGNFLKASDQKKISTCYGKYSDNLSLGFKRILLVIWLNT